MVQEKTKLFSAVEPNLAIPAYLTRNRQAVEQEMADKARSAGNLVQELRSLYSEGMGGRGTLDFLRIVTEPAQTAAEYRRMLSDVETEYLEFSRPPYAVDPLDEALVRQAGQRGVACRLLIESGTVDPEHHQRLVDYAAAGVGIRQSTGLPLKMALFDCKRGMIALLDPVITRPAWTSLMFDHEGLGEAMKHLFEDRWNRANVFAG